jgi:hypothetical protein
MQGISLARYTNLKLIYVNGVSKKHYLIYKDMDLLNVNIHLSCQYEPFTDFNVSLTIIQTIWY